MRRQQVLREAMPRKGVDLSWHDAEVSFLEGALARGGREVADVIERAWRAGAVFDAWTEEFSLRAVARRVRGRRASTPSALAAGARPGRAAAVGRTSPRASRPAFLRAERERAAGGRDDRRTARFGDCTGCGVCPTLGVDDRDRREAAVAEATSALRVRYGKTGRLRFLSHLEVMRACERSVRRAGLPYSVTQGFSPKMKVAFGPALPVGTAGRARVLRRVAHLVRPGTRGARAARGRDRPRTSRREAVAYVAEQRAVALGGADDRAISRWWSTAPAVGPEEFGKALAGVVRQRDAGGRAQGQDQGFRACAGAPGGARVVSEKDGLLVVDVTTRIGQEGSLRPEALVHAALAALGPARRPSSR